MNSPVSPHGDHHTATLTDCLLSRAHRSDPHPGVESPTSEQLADRLLVTNDLRTAANAYASLPASTSHTRAKQGWCLIWLGDIDEGRLLLEPEATGTASAELVARAVLLAGGWDGKNLRHGFSGPKAQEDRKRRLNSVLDLLQQAIDAEYPDFNAFDLMQRFGEWPYTAHEGTLAMVEGWLARTEYVGLRVWRARLLRLMEKTSNDVVQELLKYWRFASDASYFEELIESSRECGRLDVARKVLEFLREAAGAEMSADVPERVKPLETVFVGNLCSDGAVLAGAQGEERLSGNDLIFERFGS